MFINIYYINIINKTFLRQVKNGKSLYVYLCTASVSFCKHYYSSVASHFFSLKVFEEIRKGSLADERCCFSTILYCSSAAILVSDPTPAPPLPGRGAATVQSLSSHFRTFLSAGTPLQGRGAATAQSYPRTSAPPYPQALPSLVGEGQGWGQYSHNTYLPSNDSKVYCKETQIFRKTSNKPSSSEQQAFFLRATSLLPERRQNGPSCLEVYVTTLFPFLFALKTP